MSEFETAVKMFKLLPQYDPVPDAGVETFFVAPSPLPDNLRTLPVARVVPLPRSHDPHFPEMKGRIAYDWYEHFVYAGDVTDWELETLETVNMARLQTFMRLRPERPMLPPPPPPFTTHVFAPADGPRAAAIPADGPRAAAIPVDDPTTTPNV
jgi:hypothetical protein